MAEIIEDQTTGSSWSDVFSNLIDAAAQVYVAHEAEPVTATVEQPTGGTTTTQADQGKTFTQWVADNQSTLIYSFGALLVVGLVLRK